MIAGLFYGTFLFMTVVYVYALYAYILGIRLARAGPQTVLSALRYGAGFVYLVTLLKLIIYRGAVLRFFAHPMGRMSVPYFFPGGINLEATYLSLATLLFLGSRWSTRRPCSPL